MKSLTYLLSAPTTTTTTTDNITAAAIIIPGGGSGANLNFLWLLAAILPIGILAYHLRKKAKAGKGEGYKLDPQSNLQSVTIEDPAPMPAIAPMPLQPKAFLQHGNASATMPVFHPVAPPRLPPGPSDYEEPSSLIDAVPVHTAPVLVEPPAVIKPVAMSPISFNPLFDVSTVAPIPIVPVKTTKTHMLGVRGSDRVSVFS